MAMLTALTCAALHLVASAAPLHGQSTAEESLRRFLEDHTGVLRLQDRSTRYFTVFVNLNNDAAEEAIVYLAGPRWCGSGGCTVLVLRREGDTFHVVTKITVMRPPVRVLAATRNGWHSLGVWVRGGGVSPGYEAILEFDGETYPVNPTIAPAHRSHRKEKGKIIISDEPTELKVLHPD